MQDGLTIFPELQLRMPENCAEKAPCADPAALNGDTIQLGARSQYKPEALVAKWAIAYFQGFQFCHL